MHNKEPAGLRHTGAGRHPDPSSTWIPFFNGMTNSVRHLDSGPSALLRTGMHGNDESRGSMF
jgi:hypothetical protein